MFRNMFSVLFVGFLLTGCADMKGGIFPEESFNEYKARVSKRRTTFEEVSARTSDRSNLERRPNMGLNYSSGFGPGVEVDNFGDTATVITPRLWGRSKHYNRGVRQEKWRADEWRLRQEEELARRLGQQDALSGGYNLEGVPLRFVQIYYDEFERGRDSFQEQSYRDRIDNEYQRGQDDYRKGDPDYDRSQVIVNDIEKWAREDAQRGVYNPPDNAYRHYYDNVYLEEIEYYHQR